MRFIAAAILACLALPVNAHTLFCLPREHLIAGLESRFGERPEHVGFQGDTMVETWVSDNGGFTVLITRPSGLSCIIASGENWRSFGELPDIIRDTPTLKEFDL